MSDKINSNLLEAANNAAAMLGAVYKWLDMVQDAGGSTSISGIAKCHAMLKSLEDSRQRAEKLVMKPLQTAIAEALKP